MRYSSFLVSFLLMVASFASAQVMSVLRQVSSANGLTNNFVLSMATDGDGNIWVGTESGLNRVAGHHISGYKREQLGTTNDKIHSLFFDIHTDRLLIGTERGLLVYHPKLDRFDTATVGDKLEDYGLACIADDHRQGVWLIYGNGTVQHLDCITNEVTTLPLKLPGNRCGMDDGKGHLYIGHSKDGMTIVECENPKKNIHLKHKETDSRSLPGNNVRCIMQDSSGRIWVGTDCGMAVFNPVTNDFCPVRHPQGSGISDNIFDMKEMADGELWVATDVGGVYSIPLATLPFTTSADAWKQCLPVVTKRHEGQLSSMNTRCLLQDGYNNIWIGNHSTGVDFIPARRPFLQMLNYTDANNLPKRVYGMTNDSQGRIWLSSEDELSLWSCTAEENTTLQLQGAWRITGMKHRTHSFARCLMADSRGYVWLGMEDEGVIRFDTRSHRFDPIDTGYDVGDIHSFYEDADGSIWIGAEQGVCTYENGKVTHQETIDRITNRAPVTGFCRLHDGRMLLCTQGNGIMVIDTETKDTKQLTMKEGLPTNNINQLLKDRNRGIWLATREGLVYLPDEDNLAHFKVYDAKAGLSDHQIRALMQDEQGRIWVSTYTSIAFFDTLTGRFSNYSRQGSYDVGGFMEASSAIAAGGYMAFGSANGACYFQPCETAVQQEVSPIKIALCEAYSQTDSGNVVVRVMPDANGEVNLCYSQNTLRLAYAVGDYAQTNDVEYSYMMKGLNDKWYYNGTDQDIMFRSLRPGSYTFILRAKLRSQDWDNASVAQLRVRIQPPFWQTWWAYALYTLLTMGAVWWLFRQYQRRVWLKNSLEMARRENLQKQELNEERLRFFTNVTHELRTPLTLILGPLEDISLDRQLPDGVRKKVELINKSALRLRDLINEILEFRKAETNNYRLTVAKGDLGRFVREIVLNFKELNRNAQVDIVADINDGLPTVFFDSEVITTILNNLLSNAQKYTERGKITVNVADNGNGQLSISVSDTGYGIAADALPHIFDRYYQAKGSHQASGTGIGLSLAKSLANLHEAELSVQSREGEGSRFTLTLDIGNTYPNALHKEDNDSDAAKTKGDDATLLQGDAEETENEDHRPLLLVVEDNADIRQYIADSLGEDYRILQAENGEEGVETAIEHMPDIIVSDIMMPKKNGIELTHQLKDDIRTSHIPIILLTAKDSMEDKEEGYDSGADSYLTKPFTIKLLSSRIKNLLTGRRRLAEILGGIEGSHATRLSVEGSHLSRLDREFLDKLNLVIEENIMQNDIDMAFLTDKMAMSHSTFYRKVKALTGLTAKEFVRKRKLHHCYQLLESGDYNVNEAAMMTGFNQMAHFRETFKKEFGILPSEVKKKN